MGTVIVATSIKETIGNVGSIDLSVQAAKECIARAGVEKKDIGIIINCGIYRESNIVEPAMAALIQRWVGTNIDPIRDTEFDRTTFCFDLMNASCGFLNAVQVTDAIFKTSPWVTYALVVASDVHPSMERKADFPFRPYGAAALLARASSPGKGFGRILTETSDDDGHLGVFGHNNIYAHGANGRNCITVDIEDTYVNRLTKFTVQTIRKFLEKEQIATAGLKLVISEPALGFAKSIADAIGLGANAFESIYSEYGNPHTAALNIGYHVANEKKRFQENDRILWIGAGSGLTAACGLYVV